MAVRLEFRCKVAVLAILHFPKRVIALENNADLAGVGRRIEPGFCA